MTKLDLNPTALCLSPCLSPCLFLRGNFSKSTKNIQVTCFRVPTLGGDLPFAPPLSPPPRGDVSALYINNWRLSRQVRKEKQEKYEYSEIGLWMEIGLWTETPRIISSWWHCFFHGKQRLLSIISTISVFQLESFTGARVRQLVELLFIRGKSRSVLVVSLVLLSK